MTDTADTPKPVTEIPCPPETGTLEKLSSTNTTAKITVLVLMVLGIASCLFLGTGAKDVLIGIASGLVGFLSKDASKT